MSGSDPERTRHRSLLEDERAIEGLPIRLVIALVVGVAALGIMMQILTGLDILQTDTEVDVEFEDSVVRPGSGSGGSGGATVTVVDDATGEPIPQADVIVRGDTLSITAPYDDTTDADGEFSFSINEICPGSSGGSGGSGGGSSSGVSAEWRTTQDTGKLTFEVIPPADASYEDEQGNDKLTVINTC